MSATRRARGPSPGRAPSGAAVRSLADRRGRFLPAARGYRPPVPLTALAASLAAGRALLGAGYVAAPRRLGRAWIGGSANARGTTVLARAVGGRDVALGAGTIAALAGAGPSRPWFAAQALADAGDFTATLAAREGIPERGFAIALALAGGSALLAAAFAVRPPAGR